MEFKHTIDNHTFTLTVEDSVYERLFKFNPANFDPETAADCNSCKDINGEEGDYDCELIGLYDMTHFHNTPDQIHCHDAMRNLKEFYLQCKAYVKSLTNPGTIEDTIERLPKKRNGTLCKNRTEYPIVCKNGELWEDSYCYASDALKWKVDGDLTASLSFDVFKYTW